MTDNVSCKFCGTVPNADETPCVRLDDARHCEWMGDSDWKRYNASVDKARAWDAIAKARSDEREACANLALEQRCERGTPWDLACVTIAEKIRSRHPVSAVKERNDAS